MKHAFFLPDPIPLANATRIIAEQGLDALMGDVIAAYHDSEIGTTDSADFTDFEEVIGIIARILCSMLHCS